MPVLEVKKVSKVFGGLLAIKDVDLSINPGEIVGLIGPNGAGKTTLFNLITGIYHPSSGEITFNGKDLTALRPHEITEAGLARTFQNIRLFREMSVLENVMIGRHCRTNSGVLGAVLGSLRVKGRRKNKKTCRQI